jgi:hypothetical protein
MTPDPVKSYRSALRAELLEAGPAALEMLAGQRPGDPVVLLSAWKAAGLLPISTSPEERRLRERLLAEKPLLPELIWPDQLAAPEEREEQLYELVALLGVATAVPSLQLQAERLLEDFSLALALEETPPDLRETARFLLDTLDLDESHYAARLLADYAAALPALAPIQAAVDRGISGAEKRLNPGSFWAWLREAGTRISADITRWLKDQADRPTLAFAASDDGPRLHDRLLIHKNPEACLLRIDDDVVLEVDGAESPVPQVEGRPLEERPPLEEGTRLWKLPSAIPDQVLLGDQVLRLLP